MRTKDTHKIIVTLLAALLAALTALPAAAEEVHLTRWYVNEARTFMERGAWQEVKRVVDDGLRHYPSDPDLRYLNGRYYYVTRNLEQARYNLTRATLEDDQHYLSKRLLVDVEDDLRHYSSAICYINELLEFQPYDRDLWRRKIGLYRKLGNQAEADAALERLAHIYPNDTIVRRDLKNRHRETWRGTFAKSTLAEAADELEQWLDLDPYNLDYYLELAGTYEQMGELERALGTVNRGLARIRNSEQLVSKGVGILLKMGLHTQALAFARDHGSPQAIYNSALREAADDARLRDAYEVNARLYAATRDREVLTYLINTSLTRGYFDDARGFLADAMRHDGRTAPLLMKQYGLERRSGNEAAAVKVLEELYRKQPGDEELAEEYSALMLQLGSRDMQAGQWTDARDHLQRALQSMSPQSESWPSTVSRQLVTLGHQGDFAAAKALLRQAVAAREELRPRFSSAYEEMAADRLRLLMQDERYDEALQEAEDLLRTLPESETALRCCINTSQTLRHQQAFYDYAQMGIDLHPEAPYFIVKQATALAQQRRYPEALDLVWPRHAPGQWVHPQLTAAYAGIAGEWALRLMKNQMPDLALQVVDSALIEAPENRELLYTRGLILERMKEFALAYDYEHRYYNPTNAEQQEFQQHMRYLQFRGYRNRVDATYNHASYDTKADGLGSTAHLYSVATVAYSRLLRRNTYTAQVSYKGIDGYHTFIEDPAEPGGGHTENVSGGTGLELMGQWDHTFSPRWSGAASLAWSTRFFNRWSANAALTYHADGGWLPALRLGYRRTPETYLYLGDGSAAEEAQGKYHLLLLTPSLTKEWERIHCGLSLDLTALQSSIYYNVGARARLFYNDDNVSCVSLLAGFGSFPELTFFEQTALRGVSHTNSSVGFDIQYLCARNLCLGLSGSWNTCYNPYRTADGTLLANYRNIYSLIAQLHVAF